MRFSVKAHHLPQRAATGAFILNSGIGKLRADEETAAQLHGFAAGAYPFRSWTSSSRRSSPSCSR